jgi:hypothetical protein
MAVRSRTLNCERTQCPKHALGHSVTLVAPFLLNQAQRYRMEQGAAVGACHILQTLLNYYCNGDRLSDTFRYKNPRKNYNLSSPIDQQAN